MRVLAGRYEIQGTLGQGGMGVVHRALDRELGRQVAVKTLPPELLRDPQFTARFWREARTAARLSHPGIAVLHDVGEDADGETRTPFIVMEYVEGRTLDGIVYERPLSVDQAVRIAVDVLDALEHSHGQGVVHRDVKPSNVMVSGPLAGSGGTRDRVKVLDFGIARLLAETSTRLTATGATVGTPAYLSPEQAEGRDVDARSDLYSTGCLLYQLLTRQPPFLGDSPFVILLQHIQGIPVPPGERRAGVPGTVDEVVLRALAKKPGDRYPDAAAMRDALEEALPGGRAGRTGATRSAAVPPTLVDPAEQPTKPVTAPAGPGAGTPAEPVTVADRSATAPRDLRPTAVAGETAVPAGSGAPRSAAPSTPDPAVRRAAASSDRSTVPTAPPAVGPEQPLTHAPLGSRAGAWGIDAAVCLVPAVLLGAALALLAAVPAFLLGMLLVYEILACFLFGRTVGHRVKGLRPLVRATGGRPGWGAFFHTLLFYVQFYPLFTLVMVVDALFIVRNGTGHRMLHEKLSGTVVAVEPARS
ncbi:protein kinase domain-containing protein [Streptomyces sp. JNUCC 64]